MKGGLAMRRLSMRIFVLVLVAATTPGCRHQDCQCAEQTQAQSPIDPAMMAFLSRARAAHHEADVYEQDLERSLLPLISLVEGPLPGKNTTPIEVREVMADTVARIADLESQLSRFDSAAKRIERVLPLVPQVSYFRGHLFETRGLVAQRRAESLTTLGKVEEAKQARLEAVEAFEQAMVIQSAVISAASSADPVETSRTGLPPSPIPSNSAGRSLSSPLE